MEKTCKKCNQTKPFSEFGRNKTSKDGLQYYCKECNNEKTRLWIANNPGRRKEYDRKYCEKNRERRREYQRQFSKDNPFKVLASIHNNRAKREVLTADLTPEQLETIWNRYDNRCCLTGEENPTIDHVISISLGGGTTYTNIIPLSPKLNFRKNNKCLIDFLNDLPEVSEERKKALLQDLAERNGMSVESYRAVLKVVHFTATKLITEEKVS